MWSFPYFLFGKDHEKNAVLGATCANRLVVLCTRGWLSYAKHHLRPNDLGHHHARRLRPSDHCPLRLGARQHFQHALSLVAPTSSRGRHRGREDAGPLQLGALCALRPARCLLDVLCGVDVLCGLILQFDSLGLWHAKYAMEHGVSYRDMRCQESNNEFRQM